MCAGMQRRSRSLDEFKFDRINANDTLLVVWHYSLRLQCLRYGFVDRNVLGNRDAVDALVRPHDTSSPEMSLRTRSGSRFRRLTISATAGVRTRIGDQRPRRISELLPRHRKPAELKRAA